jgi:hypothetical protein
MGEGTFSGTKVSRTERPYRKMLWRRRQHDDDRRPALRVDESSATNKESPRKILLKHKSPLVKYRAGTCFVRVVLIERSTKFIQCRVTGGKIWALLRLEQGFPWAVDLDLETMETSDEKDDNNKTIKDPCETISTIPFFTCNAATEFSYPRHQGGRSARQTKHIVR